MERTAQERAGDDGPALLQLRRELRASQAQPLVGRIREWALAQAVPPQSGLGKAIAYMLGMWGGLT